MIESLYFAISSPFLIGLAVFGVVYGLPKILPSTSPNDKESTDLTSKQEHIINLVNIGAISVQASTHDGSFTLSNQDGKMTVFANGHVDGHLATLIFGRGNYETQPQLHKALKDRFSQEVGEATQDYVGGLYTKFIAGDNAPDPKFEINPNSLAIIEQQKLQGISDYEIGKQAWEKIVAAVQQGKIKVEKGYDGRKIEIILRWPDNSVFFVNEGGDWKLPILNRRNYGKFAYILRSYFESHKYELFDSVIPKSEVERILPYVSNEEQAAKQLRKNMGLDDLDKL